MTQEDLDYALSRLVPMPDDSLADWADVTGRSAGRHLNPIAGKRRASEKPRAWRRRGVLGLVAAAAAAVISASALGYYYLGPSPRFTAGLSAFDRLPRADVPETLPPIALERTAAYVGLEEAEARTGFRQLRSGLDHGDMYAFRAPGDGVCLFLARHFADCVDEANAGRIEGVFAAVSPGYPGEDPALVGMAADNVASVTLIVDGGLREEIPIINNSIYFDFDVPPTAGVRVEVRYADQSEKSFVVRPNTEAASG